MKFWMLSLAGCWRNIILAGIFKEMNWYNWSLWWFLFWRHWCKNLLFAIFNSHWKFPWSKMDRSSDISVYCDWNQYDFLKIGASVCFLAMCAGKEGEMYVPDCRTHSTGLTAEAHTQNRFLSWDKEVRYQKNFPTQVVGRREN